MYFKIIQATILSLSLIGWVLYMLLVKKKAFKEIRHDFFAILFFMACWIGIYYWMIH